MTLLRLLMQALVLVGVATQRKGAGELEAIQLKQG